MSTDDDLAPLLEDLAATLEDLRDQFDDDRPRRLRDLLRFTEQYTIPAVISLLEANIRLLELTAGAIRLSDGRLGERESPARGDVAVETLERALDDLGGALRGDPTDPEARALLEEARSLRREVRGRLETAGDDSAADRRQAPGDGDRSRRDTSAGSYEVPVQAEGDSDADDEASDVDAELETIRRQVHGEDDGSGEN